MTSYIQQLKAITKKNFLLKKENKTKTFQEIFIPLYLIIILYALKLVYRPQHYAEEPQSDLVSLNEVFQSTLIYYPYNEFYIGFVMPKENGNTITSETNDKMVELIMNNDLFSKSLKPFKAERFANNKALDDFNQEHSKQFIGGIIFNKVDDYMDYTLRVNGTSVADPSSEPVGSYGMSRTQTIASADNYLISYAPIQMVVDEAIIKMKTNDTTISLAAKVGKLSKSAIDYTLNSAIGNKLYSTYMIFIFLPHILMIVNYVVLEKEKKIKESLLISGVHPTIFWLSWYMIYFVLIAIVSLIAVIFLNVTKIYYRVNIVIFFIGIFLFGMSNCGLGFLISVFFKKSKTASTVASLISVFFAMGYMGISYMGDVLKAIFAFIFSPVAMGFFVEEIGDRETALKSTTFSDLFTEDGYKIGLILLILLANNIIYFVLVIILDNVMDNENSFLRRRMNSTSSSQYLTNDKSSYAKDIEEDYQAKKGNKCKVEVSHIFKEFVKREGKNDQIYDESSINSNSKSKTVKKNVLAVNNVSFKVYEDEIFAILGHNGAGKTTLLSMMIGVLRSNYGSVFYDGMDIRSKMNEIRSHFGVCSQTNVLYDDLTVEDHINLYAGIKGITVDINEILKEIDLVSKRTAKVLSLSGGQKRKLCIGLAIIGDPKYIFLDEPTTGLDPLSRRKIWELLLNKKMGRVIFLTTHYMDEADILADRKLIMTHGKIRCLGSSLYLKKHFHMKYNLDVETKNFNEVSQIITKYVPKAIYVPNVLANIDSVKKEMSCYNSTSSSNSGTRKHGIHGSRNSINSNSTSPRKEKRSNGIEDSRMGTTTSIGKVKNQVPLYTWKLPLNSTDSFSELFNELEENKGDEEYKLLKKFALSMPTLEELFIRLEDQSDHVNQPNNENGDEDQLLINNYENLPKLPFVKSPTRTTSILTVIKYRLKIFFQNKSFAMNAIVVPALLAIFSFVFMKILLKYQNVDYKQQSISPYDFYKDQIWNYDISNSAGLSQTMDKSIIENVFLNGTEKASKLKVDTHTTDEMNKIGQNMKIDEDYYVSSFSGNLKNEKYNFNVFYNDSMPHSLPSTLNLISNSILASKNLTERISMSSFPFSYDDIDIISIVTMVAGIYIGIALASGNACFGPLVVRERSEKLLKQIQLNGVSRTNYWISALLTDSGLYMITCLLVIIIGMICQVTAFYNVTAVVILIVVMIFWATASVLYQYVLSFMFNKEETANSFLPLFSILPVMVGVLAVNLINMNSISYDNASLFSTTAVLVSMAITFICPPFGIVTVLNSIFTIKFYSDATELSLDFKNYFAFGTGISPILIVLVLSIIVYYLLVIRLDILKNQTKASDIHEHSTEVTNNYEKMIKKGDDDVYEEFKFIKKNSGKIPISALHISKDYPAKVNNKEEKKELLNKRDHKFGDIHVSEFNSKKLVKTAVEDVSFGIRGSECFGLLGPNGAGKSTILNMITATIPQTTGKINFNGVDTHLARLGQISLGYCPQNDILWKELTLREHLEFFLRIRGYSSDQAKNYATQYIRACGLEEHENKRANKLSGGTKRKLSLLIAICGYPKQVMLDEPTAGMDPSTRRFVWNIIQETVKSNDTALVMTTHSMEEAENLCDRIAILINGRLECIGSPEHLKLKFGDGYILDVQSKNLDRFNEMIIKAHPEIFGQNYVMEKQSFDHVKYEIIIDSGIGRVFDIMEKAKKERLINDYSFSQTTLEQIFINFAKKQIVGENEN